MQGGKKVKIVYKTLHGIAEWITKEDDKEDELRIEFSPKCNGAVTLSDIKAEVKDGYITLPLRALPSGVYHPKLEADTGVFLLEGFYKEGNEVTMLETEESVIRRLVKRYYKLESENADLCERVARLEAMCRGHKIFDYERMEK